MYVTSSCRNLHAPIKILVYRDDGLQQIRNLGKRIFSRKCKHYCMEGIVRLKII